MQLPNQKGSGIVSILILVLFFGGLTLAFYKGYLTLNISKTEIQTPTSSISSTSLPSSIATDSKHNLSPARIAFIKDGEVVVKDLETNEESKTGIPIKWMDLNSTWCQGFDWSPDGTKIFARLNPVSIYDSTIKKLNPLQNFPNTSIASYQWGSDSKSLYFTKGSESGTWLYDFTNISLKQISKYSMLGTNNNYPLSYDGKSIVLSKDSGRKDKFGNLIRVGLILNLARGEEIEITLPNNASTKDPFIMDVAWSPDSYQVAYVYETNYNDDKEAIFKTYRHIGVFNLETKVSEELPLSPSSVRDPVYSPNGEYLLFENEDGPQELWVANKDGSNSKKLADKPIDFYKNPSWVADSKSIVYGNVGKGVFIVNIDGSARQSISEDGFCPIISPK